MIHLVVSMRDKMTSQAICMFACFKTVNIWRTKRFIEKLKTPSSFILILYLIQIKTRPKIFHDAGTITPFSTRQICLRDTKTGNKATL